MFCYLKKLHQSRNSPISSSCTIVAFCFDSLSPFRFLFFHGYRPVSVESIYFDYQFRASIFLFLKTVFSFSMKGYHFTLFKIHSYIHMGEFLHTPTQNFSHLNVKSLATPRKTFPTHWNFCIPHKLPPHICMRFCIPHTIQRECIFVRFEYEVRT